MCKNDWCYWIFFFDKWLRERPFNLKGEGGYGFFPKNILIPNVVEKSILILVEEKKLSDSEYLSYNPMLNSGEKRVTTKKNYNSRVVRKNNFWTNKNPLCSIFFWGVFLRRRIWFCLIHIHHHMKTHGAVVVVMVW